MSHAPEPPPPELDVHASASPSTETIPAIDSSLSIAFKVHDSHARDKPIEVTLKK